LKVCMVSQQCGRQITNGVGTYSHLLIRGMLEKGVDLQLITTEEMELDIKQTVIDVRFPDPTPNRWLSTSYSMSKALNYDALVKMRVDVVHFLDAREAFFTKDLDVPLIGTQHDFSSIIMSSNIAENRRLYPYDWFKRIPYYRLAKALEARVLRRLDAVITVCDFTKQQIINGFGVDRRKIFVIYNGFMPSIEAGVIQGNNKRENRILLITSNLQRSNLSLLLKALPLVKKEVPDVKLTVLGGDRHGTQMVNEFDDGSMRETVELLGFVPHSEVQRFMAKSKVFAMPSLYESFAFVYLEAMSHGLPSIASGFGGAPELIRDGIDGYIVDVKDVESTASKIIELLLDEERWAAFSESCLERVKAFSPGDMVEKTLEVYERVVGGRGVWRAASRPPPRIDRGMDRRRREP